MRYDMRARMRILPHAVCCFHSSLKLNNGKRSLKLICHSGVPQLWTDANTADGEGVVIYGVQGHFSAPRVEKGSHSWSSFAGYSTSGAFKHEALHTSSPCFATLCWDLLDLPLLNFPPLGLQLNFHPQQGCGGGMVALHKSHSDRQHSLKAAHSS